MSESPESQKSSEEPEKTVKAKKVARKVTRVSKVLAEKKVAPKEAPGTGAVDEVSAVPTPEAPAPHAEAEASSQGEQDAASEGFSQEEEWADNAAESAGGEAGGESSKRKRRRRRGKGGGQADPAENAAKPTPPPKVDAEVLGKAAWKIFLAEVSEEGVALVGDQDAKELAKRCFRLAEIFLEEQGRRCGRI